MTGGPGLPSPRVPAAGGDLTDPIQHPPQTGKPELVVLWVPPASEHALARSLGLVEHDRADLLAIVKAVRADLERQRIRVKVLHSRCQAVVQALSVLGLTNETQHRAAAYGWLLTQREERHATGD